jgi:hypothetical protein
MPTGMNSVPGSTERNRVLNVRGLSSVSAAYENRINCTTHSSPKPAQRSFGCWNLNPSSTSSRLSAAQAMAIQCPVSCRGMATVRKLAAMPPSDRTASLPAGLRASCRAPKATYTAPSPTAINPCQFSNRLFVTA